MKLVADTKVETPRSWEEKKRFSPAPHSEEGSMWAQARTEVAAAQLLIGETVALTSLENNNLGRLTAGPLTPSRVSAQFVHRAKTSQRQQEVPANNRVYNLIYQLEKNDKMQRKKKEGKKEVTYSGQQIYSVPQEEKRNGDPKTEENIYRIFFKVKPTNEKKIFNLNLPIIPIHTIQEKKLKYYNQDILVKSLNSKEKEWILWESQEKKNLKSHAERAKFKLASKVTCKAEGYFI